MSDKRARGGLAVATLGLILVITAAWWALALWPVSTDVPEWVLRTRAACFGRTASGLPNAGGWILLIGEPIGMLAVLMAAWGSALREELQHLRASFAGKIAIAATGAFVLFGLHAAGTVVANARRAANASLFATQPFSGSYDEARYTEAPPSMMLVDQHGESFSLDALRGNRVIVTFAYAHCETVCPTIVQDLKNARRDAGAADARLVVITLDPWRDVPSRLGTIARQWELGNDDHVLSGPVDDVLQVLDAWGVAHARDTKTGEVAHSSSVVLLDREGRVSYKMSGDWQRAAKLLQTL